MYVFSWLFSGAGGSLLTVCLAVSSTVEKWRIDRLAAPWKHALSSVFFKVDDGCLRFAGCTYEWKYVMNKHKSNQTDASRQHLAGTTQMHCATHTAHVSYYSSILLMYHTACILRMHHTVSIPVYYTDAWCCTAATSQILEFSSWAWYMSTTFFSSMIHE